VLHLQGDAASAWLQQGLPAVLHALPACRDLAVGTSGSLVYMLPGGLAAFAPSVNDIDINTMEQLLPNSASTRLYVASGDTQLNVFNISGQTLQAQAPVRGWS
jgi:hypothetical protein